MGHRFDEALIQRVKRCDLVEYFQSVAEDPHIEKHGNYFTARCPHPDHEDKHPSFVIYHNADGTYSFTCLSCHCGKKNLDGKVSEKNYGSDIIAFVRWMSDHKKSSHILTFTEAMIKILEFYHIPVPKEVNNHPETVYHVKNKKLMNLYSQFFIETDCKQKEYFFSRGFDQADANEFKIGSDGDKLVFPLIDYNNRVVGFTRRTIRDETPKYIHSGSSEGFIKSEFLYNINKLNLSNHTVYITEGTLDVISGMKYGMTNILACLGTAFQDTHAKMLKNFGIKKIVFVFDNDPAGEKALSRSIEIARQNEFSVDIIKFTDVNDLDEFCQKYKENTLSQIEIIQQPDYEYELSDFVKEYQEQQDRIRNKYIPTILAKAKKIKDEKEYELFKNYIFNKFNINLESKDV